MCIEKNYGLVCTESVIYFFIFFKRKREKLAKNLAVKGENGAYLGRKDNFFSRQLKQFLALKIGDFLEKLDIFSAGIENFCDRIHDPQTSNQIDAVTI